MEHDKWKFTFHHHTGITTIPGIKISYQKQFVTVPAPLDTIPIFLRGGAILPIQEFANNTKYSRLVPKPCDVLFHTIVLFL